MDPAALLDALDPEQREAVLAPQGPLCILAGAGTGKTRTITHRIAHSVVEGRVAPEHVLAVTFTARAAGELRTRLRGLAGREVGVERVQARTFHAAALRQLTYFWPRVVGGALPTVLDSKYPLVSTSAARCGLRLSAPDVRDLIAEIEWAKARLITPESYGVRAAASGREVPRPSDEVARVYAAYEESKARSGNVDFDDLLLMTAAAIEDHDDVADEVRSRYRSFVVDEYQDVNPLQQRLLDAWLGERDDLTVVGDDDQTIYSFSGASRDYLLRFGERHPGATVVRLIRDYRSTPQVVALANKVIAADPSRRGVAKRLVAQRPDGPEPVFVAHDSEPEEARDVARRIRALLDAGTPASEMAVLYRVNAQSQAYETALTDLAVPYLLRGGERFFERREVREALVALRAATRADDLEGSLAEQVREVLGARLDWRADEAPGGGAARDRWEALAALVRLAEDAELEDAAEAGESGDAARQGLVAFVAHLEERAADAHAPTVQGVTLATLHTAKGLEWDAVFLVGLVDGTLPIQQAQTPEQVAEERRLLYVGITRARVHLCLSWALARQEGGRRGRKRSRFLDVVSPPEPLAPSGSKRRDGPVRCRVCSAPLVAAVARKLGRCEDCPSDVDDALVERLKDWRRTAADGKPAYVVFTDATLLAIAERKPSSFDELAAIAGVGPTKLERYGKDVLALVTTS